MDSNMYAASATQMSGIGQALPARPPRPMERVGIAADRIENINARLVEIIDRFHGNPASTGRDNAPVTISYLGNIERLHGNLDTLDNLVGALGEIG